MLLSNERVIILDSGSPYVQILARRVRECGVFSQVVPGHLSAEEIQNLAPKGILHTDDCSEVKNFAQLDIPAFAVPLPVDKAQVEKFLRDDCGCRCDWNMKKYAEQAVEQIKEQVGEGQVICGLSGGVDSAVVAALVSKAIGKRLKCIFVDHGLLRKGEADSVEAAFSKHFDIDFRKIDAADGFLERLAGVEEPQEKRRRIGHYFIDVFAQAAQDANDSEDGSGGAVRFLAQGTIYPDIIESMAKIDRETGKPLEAIKLHHNVGGLPEKLGFQLVEPLRQLFKDEVRQLGLELGLAEDFVWRHPFPGPGLAVRCLGEVTREKLAKLREADAIVVEEIHKAGLYRQVSQAFAVLLPVKSVGVSNGLRTYDDAVAVRCVKTDDFMTADWSVLPTDLLKTISSRIISEVDGVNRVVYDISTKPPATIEWE